MLRLRDDGNVPLANLANQLAKLGLTVVEAAGIAAAPDLETLLDRPAVTAAELGAHQNIQTAMRGAQEAFNDLNAAVVLHGHFRQLMAGLNADLAPVQTVPAPDWLQWSPLALQAVPAWIAAQPLEDLCVALNRMGRGLGTKTRLAVINHYKRHEQPDLLTVGDLLKMRRAEIRRPPLGTKTLNAIIEWFRTMLERGDSQAPG